MAFPPVPVYPKAIDSDYTLYLVFDTTETRLSVDNVAWSQEIEIVPVEPEKPEIWADNGFANIDGELLYYDSVERNSYGKINKLKNCERNLGGEKTKFNKKGIWIRSYVVAEHHNQLVSCVLKTQNFIGYNFDPRRETLDWRIRNLQALEVIFDDFNCPDINFTWNIIENNPVTGILAEYLIEISPPGTVSDFRLDFGDGNFTTTELSGQHRYPVNARVDTVIRVSNEKCQIIQTPIERDNPAEPPPDDTPTFEVEIPEFPDIPDFTFVPCDVPEADINVPPLVVPCISIEGQVGPLPSVIITEGLNVPSIITATGLTGVPSTITVTGVTIPSVIVVDTPPIPPTIIIEPPIPPTIVIVPPQSNIAIDVDFTEMPRLAVDWGTPPEMEVAMTFAREVKIPERFAADEKLMADFGEEFADLFETKQTMKIEYEPVGIPSEIRVILPEDTSLKLDTSDLDNKKIQIDATSVDLPESIQIHGPDSPIPDSIVFDASDFVQAIERLQSSPPIKLDASGIPKSIKIDLEKEIPKTIVVEMPNPIPEKIVVESQIPDRIILEGPEGIPLILPDEFVLPVKFPDKMPEVELVWKGSPIEVKVTLDEVLDKEADGRNCVMIVPCKK